MKENIYKKIYNAKKHIGKISKDSTNPFFKSKYFDINTLLEHVEPILEENNLLLLQPIQDGLVKTFLIDIDTKESVESAMQLPTIQDSQKLGSAITYYRRYTLQSLLGLQAEDDDGNKSSKQIEEQRKPSLTLEQFNKAKKFTKANISKCLRTFRMSEEQRTELTKLL